MTLTYGEQGRYSTAQEVITQEPKVGPMIPVTFVAQPIGRATPSSPVKAGGKAGGGICMLDVTGDGRFDLVVMGDGEHAIRVYHNAGDGGWKELPPQQTGLDASGTGISCAVGDFDNDGQNDLAVALSDRVLLFRNLGGGKFADVTKSAGIVPVNRPAGLTFVDYDHDGDLDLFVTGQPGGTPASSSNVLWRNNGNGTFTNWTAETGLGGEGATTSVVLSDINNDRAVDLVVTGSGSAPTLYLNPREGHFKASPLYDVAGLPPTVGVYVFDFNKDGWMDVALTHAGAPGVSLWRNVDGKRFERVPLPVTDATRGWGVTAIDFDNDGWIDLAVVLETARGPELRMLRNTGRAGIRGCQRQAWAGQDQAGRAALRDRRRRGWRQRLRSHRFATRR